jgi:hypothetical protein
VKAPNPPQLHRLGRARPRLEIAAIAIEKKLCTDGV